MPMEKNFDPAAAEDVIYQKWEDKGAFKAGANARAGAKPFSIMIPPPNVTGSLHMGHAFNNTLQDILIRWHRMRGDDTLWQPGTDHAGIATQMVVERELAANQEPGRREMVREAFIDRVWQQKVKSRGNIIGQLKRLGASCDWSREAFTMGGAAGDPDKGKGPNFHDAVIKVFVEMYNKGLIYRGKRLVNWDPHFETAISDLEVEQIEVNGKMWRLRYALEGGETYTHVEKDEDGNEISRETRNYLTVATTRPETMLGDTGVAVHPEDERYKHLVGKTVKLPICGRSIPIVADEYADPDKGTGAVKITPAHDFNDAEVGKRTGLRTINVMTTRAAMWLQGNADFAEGCDPAMLGRAIERYDGRDRYEVRDAIVTEARDDGWLDGIDEDRHMVPHGDRSKVAIEPYLTDQWFVDAEKIVTPALDAVRNGDTEILPESDKKVYFHWLENIEPWCISRQLWWGHQIPVWYGPKKHVDEMGKVSLSYNSATNWRCCVASEEQAINAAKEYYGTEILVIEADSGDRAEFDKFFGAAALDAWLSGARRNSAGDRATPIYRDPDVLDTWFSSGLWPIGTLGWTGDAELDAKNEALQKYFPTSVLITGFDIIFFWVARMMMMQYAVVGQKPFDTVYVHALVRDENGKKMSKSLGNVLDPLELIDEYGADAVRFTLTAMAAMGRDLKLSTQRIAGYRNFGTKLWNAARFAEMNDCKPVADFDPARVSQAVNKWIIGETARVREAVDASLAQFRFNDAAGALYAYVWGKVCDWYVELAKPLFQGEDEVAKAETRATMAWAIDQCLILLHPIMPFITEQLWGDIAERQSMLIHADWPTYTMAELVDPAADREMNWVIGLIEQIRSVRQEMNVPAGAKIRMIELELDKAGQAALAGNLSMVMRLARIETLEAARDAPKGAVTLAVEGGTFCLPLADVIDVAAEKARLQKALDKLCREAGGLNGKLANEKFLANAPADVVQTQRDRLLLIDEEIATLTTAYDRIAALG